jgi:hypothetical protein
LNQFNWSFINVISPLMGSLRLQKKNNLKTNFRQFLKRRVILLLDTVINITMDQGEPGIDYNEPNLNPLVCDLCKQKFNTLDRLGEHQKEVHDM